MDFNYSFSGKLSPDLRLEIDFVDTVARLLEPHIGVPLEINIKKFHKQRSLAQNSWLWGVCIVTIRAWMKELNGMCPSAEAVYAFLRIKVVGQEVVIEEVNGVDVPVVSGKRFSQMTTVEFSEAVEKIVLYYAEMGLEIPLPQAKGNQLINQFTHNET